MFSDEPIEDNRIKVLAIGPTNGTVTGQSIAFSTFASHTRHQVDIINTNATGKNIIVRAWMTIVGNFHAINKIFFTAPPDIIYITTSRSRFGAIKDIGFILLARLRKIPVVNHLHGNTFQSFRNSLGFLYRNLLDWTYRYIHLSIVLHEKFTSTYDCYPLMKTTVVNNFVSHEILEFKFSKTIEPTTINILFLSNIIKEKGVLELMDAVCNLSSKYPNSIKLKIAGNFIDSSNITNSSLIEKFNKTLSISNSIEYIGIADMPTKIALLDWAHVFALPSYTPGEAVPLSLLEAMCAGCYIIISDHGILPDLLNNQIGIVVPIKSALAIEQALLEVLSNKSLISQANLTNADYAKKHYSQEKYVTSIDNIIFEACKDVLN
jgi:glycosyltransferase involved in cell wall biosynthesis